MIIKQRKLCKAAVLPVPNSLTRFHSLLQVNCMSGLMQGIVNEGTVGDFGYSPCALSEEVTSGPHQGVPGIECTNQDEPIISPQEPISTVPGHKHFQNKREKETREYKTKV